jgi:ribonuclease P protein component
VRVHSDAFVVVAACEPTSVRARLGCAVSKKVGDAPTRARLRRLLREIFRRLAASLPAVDLVVIAKPGAAALAVAGLGPTADELVPALEKAARRALERSTSRGRSRR